MTKYMPHLLTLILSLVQAGILATQPTKIQLQETKGVFIHQQGDKKPIPVWYYLPANNNSQTPMVFVMHGVKRNADEYRDAWSDLAEKHQFILLVPEFSKQRFPKSLAYNLGNIVTESGQPIDKQEWSFTVIESVFDEVRKQLQNDNTDYYIYGHSAGAQFVHRLLMFLPEARVKAAIAANAGWYTLPRDDVEFPYGLKNTSVSRSDIGAMLTTPLVILLGDQDVDVNNQYLRKTTEANAQGPHRYARGQYFYHQGKAWSEATLSEFNWDQITVKGVGHDNRRMAPAAAKILAHWFNKPSTPR